MIAALVAGLVLAGCDSTSGESRRDQLAVTGKPFGVSDSVTAYCATRPVVAMCEEFAPRLAEFLAESRDAEWADSMERQIAQWMLADRQSPFEMRALECRRTRCAFEYAVTTDAYGQTLDGYEELDRHMELTGGVTAPELTSGTGHGKWVSVMIWRKRS
ncbi:MAG TPA: hypothetical protein VFU13_02805 [Steroidobacteraceae bacterium]|nr:hypothetical protein [Steroidobacteraceae bacterium]